MYYIIYNLHSKYYAELESFLTFISEYLRRTRGASVTARLPVVAFFGGTDTREVRHVRQVSPGLLARAQVACAPFRNAS